MLGKVTQDNLYVLIPWKVAGCVSLLLKERGGLHLKQALLEVYRSRAYRLLEREETKLWHESPAQIYAEYLASTHRLAHGYRNGPGHSKLQPFIPQLDDWRSKGMTLKEMRTELLKYGCETTVQNISRFIRHSKVRNQ